MRERGGLAVTCVLVNTYTPEATAEYNRRLANGDSVAGLFHTGCL